MSLGKPRTVQFHGRSTFVHTLLVALTAWHYSQEQIGFVPISLEQEHGLYRSVVRLPQAADTLRQRLTGNESEHFTI